MANATAKSNPQPFEKQGWGTRKGEIYGNRNSNCNSNRNSDSNSNCNGNGACLTTLRGGIGD